MFNGVGMEPSQTAKDRRVNPKCLSKINSAVLWCSRPGCLGRRDACTTTYSWTGTKLVAALALAGLFVAGCARPLSTRLTLPDTHTLVRDQLVVHSEFPLPAHHRLLEELTARRVDLSQSLMLPVSDEPIHVYVFQTPGEFEAFMRLRHPSFPQRRAFFLETDTRLEVYAQWGDRVAEDLRHEVTHGYLHSVVPNLPLWLDEGLAEYFEVARGQNGVNGEHVSLLVERLRTGGWRPELERLEALSPDMDMTQADYAEAWAWVHLLLASHPARRELLRDFLRDSRQHGSARPLSAGLHQLGGQPEEELAAHVERLSGVAAMPPPTGPSSATARRPL
jgi:hypothetical protein